MGRSLLRTTREAKAAADEYALSTVTAVCRKWDKDELARQLDTAAEPGVLDAVIATGKPLGSLREATPFVATAMDVSPEHGSKSIRVTVRDTATFEHGEAQLRLKVVYLGDVWKIREFQITPTAVGAKQ